MWCVTDPNGNMHNLVLVAYKYDGIPQDTILVNPHGNSKKMKPYHRVMESTKKKLSNVLTTEKLKKAVDIVYEEKGGLLRAKSAGQLPHSRDQAYYLKKKQQQKAVAESVGCSVGEVARDMLYAVMLQCKSTEGCDRFVQDVTCAPEPMAVLATDQQLFDMEIFCCDPFKFSILGIDPTFNLGEFSVTPIVYKHLLLKDSKSHNNPLVLGPLLIHHRKQFCSYNYFLSTIVGLRPKLTYIQAVGRMVRRH